MKSFFGIPAHPLLLHIPAVLLPLAVVGVVFMVIRPTWHQRYRWPVLAIGFIGALGAILATSAGESLADPIVVVMGSSNQSDGDVGDAVAASLVGGPPQSNVSQEYRVIGEGDFADGGASKLTA